MKILVHACDLTNASMKFDNFRQWGLRITQEFDDLFVAEKDLNEIRGTDGAHGCTPPLPFLEYKNYKGFCMGQIGFISK
jgi:hypothetical protein